MSRLTLLATVSLLLLSTAAAATQWKHIVSSVAKLPAPTGYNKDTSLVFSRNLATFIAARDTTDTNYAYPANIKDYFTQLRVLKTSYNKPTGTDTRPHVVVIGAGPMGLATAYLIAKKGTHRVTVFEKSNGNDTRWNAILASNELKDVLVTDLGFTFGPEGIWIGQLPEFEYVMGATLLLMGVEIHYNTMYLHTCEDSTHKHTVHTVLTPADKELRYAVYTETDICGTGRDNFLTTKGLVGHVSTSVDVLIGADGTQSAVRKTQFAADAVTGTQDEDKTFPAVITAKPTFWSRNAAVDGFDVTLHKDGVVDDPLLTHVIISFSAADETEAQKINLAIEDAIATRYVEPLTVTELGPLVLQRTLSQREFSVLIGSGIRHKMEYVNDAGDDKRRVYVELLMRHEASKVFRHAFEDAIGRTDLLINIARGAPLDTITYDRKNVPKEMSTQAKAALANRLLPVLYKFLDTSALTYGSERLFSKLFPTQDDFNGKLEKVKIFHQQLRKAVKVASKKAGLRIILVGDATRDSYYAYGNSVNSAYTAIHQHVDGLLGPDTGFDAAATAYKTEVVDKFTNFIGADIYMRTFCGCLGSSQDQLKDLRYVNIVCTAAKPDQTDAPTGSPKRKKIKKISKPITPTNSPPVAGPLPDDVCPRIMLSFLSPATACSKQTPTDFFDTIKDFCDPI